MTARRALLALFLGACSSGAPPAALPASRAAHWSGSLAPAPPPDAGSEASTVVAVVNGDPIYVADVAVQAQATGRTVGEALDELVAAQLFAQEAVRRGLADDPDVTRVRERESVRRLLTRFFEPSFDGPEDIPMDEVEAVYNHPDVKPHYEHEEFHSVVYVRYQLKAKAPAEDEQAGKVGAEKMHAILVAAKPKDEDEFYEVAKGHPELGVTVSVQKPFTTSINGPAHPAFARVAMALKKIGEISQPVRTPWGWDILFLVSIVPEKHTPRSEWEPDLRQHWFEPARKRAFEEFVSGLLAGHQIVKNEAALEAVQVDSLVGIP